jgi:CreA protein
MKILYITIISLLLFSSTLFLDSHAGDTEVGCVTTTWKLIGANHKVCVNVFHDPEIPNVICHISQARTGGLSGVIGVAEDVSEFSLSCVQIGPVPPNLMLSKEKEVFNERTSLFFKGTQVNRFYDKDNNALVYLAISRKIINGSPKNSVSNVALSPWTR